MKCPLCNEEIDRVIVNSSCFQTGHLKEYAPGVWGISDFENDVIVEDTISHQCPSCMETIPTLREDLWLLMDSELYQLVVTNIMEDGKDLPL